MLINGKVGICVVDLVVHMFGFSLLFRLVVWAILHILQDRKYTTFLPLQVSGHFIYQSVPFVGVKWPRRCKLGLKILQHVLLYKKIPGNSL